MLRPRPLEKTLQLQNQVQKRQNLFIQAQLEDITYQAPKLQIVALQLNSDIETDEPPVKDSFLWWLYNREMQYFRFVELTAAKKPLSLEDTHYLILSLLPRQELIDKINSIGHDYSWAKIMGWYYGSEFFSNHALPEINKTWGLQSLSYMMENKQLKAIETMIQGPSLRKDLSFLAEQFRERLHSQYLVIQRISAVALCYLPCEISATTYLELFKILKEMISCQPSIKCEKIDEAFNVEKEKDFIKVRLRAARALNHLSKISRQKIPDEFLEDMLRYLHPLEHESNFYLGEFENVSSKEISKGYCSLKGYEKEALDGKILTEDQIEYLCRHHGNEHSLMALFYAVSLNQQTLPIHMHQILLKSNLLNCYENDIKISSQSFPYALLLLVGCQNGAQFPKYTIAANYLVDKFSENDPPSIVRAQCCAAFSYAIKHHSKSQTAYLKQIDKTFDPIRIEVLSAITHTFEVNQKADWLSELAGKIPIEAVTALAQSSNSKLSIVASFCLQYIASGKDINLQCDENMKNQLLKDLKIRSERQNAVKKIAILIRNFKIDTIPPDLFKALDDLFCSAQDATEIVDPIIDAFASLLEISFEKKIEIDFSFTQKMMETLGILIQSTKINDTWSVFFLNLAQNATKNQRFQDNAVCMMDYVSSFEVILSGEYEETVQSNIFSLIKNLIIVFAELKRKKNIPHPTFIVQVQSILLLVLKKQQSELKVFEVLSGITPLGIQFTDDLLEELINQLGKKDFKISCSAQVVLRNYICGQKDCKFPDKFIISLIDKLTDENYFILVQPLVQFLIVEQSYNSSVPSQAIRSLVKIILEGSDSMAFFSGEILSHCEKSLSVITLMRIRRDINLMYEREQYLRCLFLLRSFFAAIICSNQCEGENIIDNEIVQVATGLLEKSMVQISDRQLIYQCFTDLPLDVPVTVTLIDQALDDLRLSEDLAISAVKWIKSVLNSKSFEISSEFKKITRVLAEVFVRPILKQEVFDCVLCILRKDASVSEVINHSFLEFCLNVQYELFVSSLMKETAADILTRVKFRTEDESLRQTVQTVLQMETLSEQHLGLNLLTGPFLNQIHAYSEKHLLGSTTVGYILSMILVTTNELLVRTVINISKHEQNILPILESRQDVTTELFKRNFKECLEIINNCMIRGASIFGYFIDKIEEYLETYEEKYSVEQHLLEILEKYTKTSKRLSDTSLDRLRSLLDKPKVSDEQKSIIVFILAVHIKEIENNRIENENENENRFLVNLDQPKKLALFDNILFLVINTAISSSSFQLFVRLLEILSLPNKLALVSGYLELKTSCFLIIGGAEGNGKELLRVAAKLDPRQSSAQEFIEREDVQKDLKMLMNDAIGKLWQKFDRSEAQTVLEILLSYCYIAKEFSISLSIIQKLSIYSLRITDMEEIRLIFHIFEFIDVENIAFEYLSWISQMLKFFINSWSSPQLIHQSIQMFRKINTILKEFSDENIIMDDELFVKEIQRSYQDSFNSSPIIQKLCEEISIASNRTINFTHEYYLKRILNMVRIAEFAAINLDKLLDYIRNKSFSFEDFEYLGKLFYLLQIADQQKDSLTLYKLSGLINNCNSFGPAFKNDILQLLRTCEICFILQKLNLTEKRELALQEALLKLLSNEWDPETLVVIGDATKEVTTSFFEAMVRYSMSPVHTQTIISIVKNSKETNYLSKLHEFFLTITFGENQHSSKKSIEELMDEFERKNKGYQSSQQSEEMRQIIKKVQINSKLVIQQVSRLIVDKWTEADFKRFAKLEDIQTISFQNILKVINQAVKVWSSSQQCLALGSNRNSVNVDATGYYLREAQLLVIYSLYYGKSNLVCQLSTGEGKSLVLAVTALLKVLTNKQKKVDIIVTSPILAERDAIEFKDFFSLFGVTCAHNNSYTNTNDYQKHGLECYKADIVYGDISQFQFDFLKHEFQQLNTRGERNLDFVLVDEADSIMIDQAPNIAKLSEIIPSFDHLDFIFICIWSRLERLLTGYRILFDNPMGDTVAPETVYIYKSKETNELRYKYLLFDINLEKKVQEGRIEDHVDDPEILQDLNTMANDSEVTQYEVSSNKAILTKNYIFQKLFSEDHYYIAKAYDPNDNELRISLLTSMESMLDSSNFQNHSVSNERLRFPQHLKTFILTHLSIWIKNAIIAKFQMHLHRDYVIRKDENQVNHICPVDNLTGVTLINTNWSDGIHQFIQLKEGLKLSSETLTTNFISNYSFLKRYEQLLGVTGTLGNENTRNLFVELYGVASNKVGGDSANSTNFTNLKCLLFPSFRQQKCFVYPHTIVSTTQQWLMKIKSSVCNQRDLDRAVLIICQNIEQLDLIKKEIDGHVICFRRSDEDTIEISNLNLISGQVLLTTNLGGRGIDPKPSVQVNEKGGLHVIVTFLTENERIYKQAEGRTARNGNTGTAETIIDVSALFEVQTEQFNRITPFFLDHYQSALEQRVFLTLKQQLIKEISEKDQLFTKFCTLLQQKTTQWKKKQSKLNNFINSSAYFLSTLKYDSKKRSLIERWGLWLKNLDLFTEKHLDHPSLDKLDLNLEFEIFRLEIEQADQDDTIIQNPAYLFQEINGILEYVNSWKHCVFHFGLYGIFHEAILNNCNVVQDPLFLVQANAFKAYTYLRSKEEELTKDSKDEDLEDEEGEGDEGLDDGIEEEEENEGEEGGEVDDFEIEPLEGEKKEYNTEVDNIVGANESTEAKIPSNNFMNSNHLARNYFKEAVNNIKDYNYPQLSLQQYCLKTINHNVGCDFISQISDKLSIISTFATMYENAAEQVDSARKLINLRLHYTSALLKKETKNYFQHTQKECLKVLKKRRWLFRRLAGASAGMNQETVDLEFHDLRIVTDIGIGKYEEPYEIIQKLDTLKLGKKIQLFIVFKNKSSSFYYDLIKKLIEKSEDGAKCVTEIIINKKSSDGLLQENDFEDINQFYQERKKITKMNKNTKSKKNDRTVSDYEDYHANVLTTYVQKASFHTELKAESLSLVTSIIIPLSQTAAFDKQGIMRLLKTLQFEIPEAILKVERLSISNAIDLLKGITLKEESFKNIGLRDISTIFANPNKFNEIQQFRANGFQYFFELTERQQLKVYSMRAIGGIAAAEVIAGSLILALSSPTVFGIALDARFIADGILEGFELLRICITHELNWLHWGIQRTVSVGLMFLTAAVSSAMAAKKTKSVVGLSHANSCTTASAEVSETRRPSVTTSFANQVHHTVSKPTYSLSNKVVIREVTKQAVFHTVRLVSAQLGEVITPQIYAEVEGRIRRLVEESVTEYLNKESKQLYQLFAFVHMKNLTDYEFRLKKEINETLTTLMKEKLKSPSSYESLKNLFFDPSVIHNLIQPCILTCLEQFFSSKESQKMNFKTLIVEEVQGLDLAVDDTKLEHLTNQILQIFIRNDLIEANDDRYHLKESNSYKSEKELRERLDQLHNWPRNLEIIKERILNHYCNFYSLLFPSFGLLYGMSHQALSSNSPIRFQCQRFKDVVFIEMVSVITKEMNKTANFMEGRVKGAVQSLTGISSHQLLSPLSFVELKTWEAVKLLMKDDRYLEDPIKITANKIDEIIHTFLSIPIDLEQSSFTHYHERYTTHVERSGRMHLQYSMALMQRYNPRYGFIENYDSPERQQSRYGAQTEEQRMIQEFGLSFADQKNLSLALSQILENNGIGKLLNFLDSYDEQIEILKNLQNDSTERSKFLIRYWSKLNAFGRWISLTILTITDILSLFFFYVTILLFHFDGLKEFHQYRNRFEQYLQHQELMRGLSSETFWQELARHAQKIPSSYTHFKNKLLLFENVLNIQHLQFILFTMIPDDTMIIEFLEIFKDCLVMNHGQCLLYFQTLISANNIIQKLHSLMDLLATASSFSPQPALYSNKVISKLLDWTRKHLPSLLELITKLTNGGEEQNATTRRLSSLLQQILSSIDAESDKLFPALKEVITIYGNFTPPSLLFGIVIGRFFYHQPQSFYNNLHSKEVFNEIEELTNAEISRSHLFLTFIQFVTKLYQHSARVVIGLFNFVNAGQRNCLALLKQFVDRFISKNLPIPASFISLPIINFEMENQRNVINIVIDLLIHQVNKELLCFLNLFALIYCQNYYCLIFAPTPRNKFRLTIGKIEYGIIFLIKLLFCLSFIANTFTGGYLGWVVSGFFSFMRVFFIYSTEPLLNKIVLILTGSWIYAKVLSILGRAVLGSLEDQDNVLKDIILYRSV